MHRVVGFATGAALTAVLTACAGAPVGAPSPSPAVMAPPASCVVLSGAETRTDRREPGSDAERRPEDGAGSITLGLTRPVDPNRAPVPENVDEAMVFGMVYQPLVRMDCTGGLHPGLAASWEPREDGRRWTFTLRSDSRFADGTEVTALHVAESWRRTEEAGRSPWGPRSSSDRPLTIDVLDSRRLELTFAEARSALPRVLTTTGLAVAGPAGGDGPSPGTGPYRFSGMSNLEPRVDGLPILALRSEAGEDPRNLLGAGVDVVVTDEPETLEYARLRPDLVHRSLPWSRRYLVVTRAPGHPPPDAFLEELARDVVRTDARPAVGLGCVLTDPRSAISTSRHSPAPGATVPPVRRSRDPSGPNRIGYERDDPTGRALAERLVALITAPGGSRDAGTGIVLRMLGLDDPPGGLVASPARGPLGEGELARVASVPRRPDVACRGEGDRSGSAGVRDPSATGSNAIPLVETRQSLIARTPTVPVAVDGTGTPYFFFGRAR